MSAELTAPSALLCPGSAASALRRAGVPWVNLLESGLDLHGLGRWNVLLGRPLAVAIAESGQDLRLVHGSEALPRSWPGDPLAGARDLLERTRPADWRPEPGVPFSGGAVLALSYDLGRRYERLPSQARADASSPDLVVAVYGGALTWEAGATDARWVGSSQEPPLSAHDLELARSAEDRPSSPPSADPATWPSTFDAPAYRAAVAEIQRLIRRGDAFEVNLSRRYTYADVDLDAAYEALRAAAPAPFMADLDLGRGRRLLSASPERFLSLTAEGHASSWPIKGTRPRGATPAADAAALEDLLASTKDAAELAMIVDLVRNDLGRVAAPGSVRVVDPRRVQSWPTVHHTVGVVEAQLDAGRTWVDLVRAAFPPGSVTGAPKIRAQEIIDALEPVRRGSYCGAFGYVGFDGALDLAVAIRILASEGSRTHAHAGGAVLLGSDPADEERETLAKARALIQALAHGRGTARG